MKKNKKLKWFAPILLTTGMLAACGDDEVSKGTAEDDYEITVGLSQSAGGTLVDIAYQEGYFEEENLKVDRVGFANSADGLNALQLWKIKVSRPALFGASSVNSFLTVASLLIKLKKLKSTVNVF